MAGHERDGDADRDDPFANLTTFKPKAPSEVRQARALDEDIQKIAKDNNFPSRQPQIPEPEAVKPGKRRRFNSSGPKAQLNIKVPLECHARFYRMAEERNIRVLGDLLEQALDALEQQDSR
ncbi:stability/partitioning determinant [Azotobacter salinestris]|uniref:stability/partitioning determinant n=1 Tax=Azotobacter salinestris TaxID=69964 RepID=UPI0032E0540F